MKRVDHQIKSTRTLIRHVLKEHPIGFKVIGNAWNLVKQAAAYTRQSFSLAERREVLAREPPRYNLHIAIARAPQEDPRIIRNANVARSGRKVTLPRSLREQRSRKATRVTQHTRVGDCTTVNAPEGERRCTQPTKQVGNVHGRVAFTTTRRFPPKVLNDIDRGLKKANARSSPLE